MRGFPDAGIGVLFEDAGAEPLPMAWDIEVPLVQDEFIGAADGLRSHIGAGVAFFRRDRMQERDDSFEGSQSCRVGVGHGVDYFSRIGEARTFQIRTFDP